MQKIGGGKLATLDGLRGIAAIVVMLYHIGNLYKFGAPFQRGYLFVDFFFLLSGFVLALSAEPRFATGWTTLSFVVARVVRLWPVIAIGAISGAISFGLRNGWTDVPLYIVLALTFVPLLRPWATEDIYPLNPPQWSLLFELLANLLHGLLLRRLRNGTLLVFSAVFAIFILRISFLNGNVSIGPSAVNWYFGLPRVGFAYATGVWLGRRYSIRGSQGALTTWPIALMLPLFAVIAASAIRDNIWLVDSLVVIIVFPLSLWIAASVSPDRMIARWLDRLGALSFPLYAVHLPIIMLFASFDKSAISANMAVATSLIAAATIAATFERRRKRVRSANAPLPAAAVIA
jgi:peptidoglycan/LPS O-acetylase OafA/YrhL